MADAQQLVATTSSSVQPSGPGEAFSPETLRKVAEEVRTAFPRRLSEPELVLIDVDPRRVHAFWTLPPATLDTARRGLGREGEDAPMVLRLHPVLPSGATAAPFDVEVIGAQGRCYVDIWDDGRIYRGELGLRRSDGLLVPLAAPADVELPHLGPIATGTGVTRAEMRTLPAKEQATSALVSEPVRHPFPLPPGTSESIADLNSPDHTALAGGALGAQRRILLDEPPTSEPAASVWRPHTLAPTSERSPEPVRHPFPLPPVQAAEFDPSALIGGFLPPLEGRQAATPEITGDVPPAGEAGAEPQPAGGAHKPVAPAAEEPAAIGLDPSAALPLENVLTLSSYALGRETVEFEVNAELHVFGRAKPGTQLQLFGRKVPLRPDGTFSITRPLPSGALVLSSLLVGDDKREPGDQ